MDTATITPEEQAANDEVERARQRREERAAAADDGFHDPAAQEPGDGAQDADPEPEAVAPPIEPAPEGEEDENGYVLVIGGKAPTEDQVVILGGQIAVKGAPAGGFEKGETYELRVVVKCRGHLVDDTEDGKTGQVVNTKKVDRLKIKSARVSKG